MHAPIARFLFASFVCCFALPSAGQGSGDPMSVVSAYREAMNAHDLERALALFSDDAELVNTRGRKVTGKSSLRSFLQGNINSQVSYLKVESPEVTGDAVTYDSWATADWSEKLGMGPMRITWQGVLTSGRIRTATVYFPPEELDRLAKACEKPEAQGVLLYSQPCAEFLKQAGAHTERMVAQRRR